MSTAAPCGPHMPHGIILVRSTRVASPVSLALYFPERPSDRPAAGGAIAQHARQQDRARTKKPPRRGRVARGTTTPPGSFPRRSRGGPLRRAAGRTYPSSPIRPTRLPYRGGGRKGARRGMGSSDNTVGLALAVASSAFVGSSFILKKIGLMRAGKLGVSAGGGGYTYLLEPLWWAGLITMLLGEVANCVAYVFAPAVLVTPLGALSIIVSSVLAHFVLKEHLNKLGVLGCISCIVGSVVVVLHAPEEIMPNSVEEIWDLATQPGFLAYALTTFALVATLVLFFESRYGQKNILIYLGICSTMGSLTVVSIKAVGVAIKLTLDGTNQLFYPHTWLFVLVTIVCGVSQLNYLNKALDTFDLAIVSPVYYVLFTTLTIVANGIMFKDGADQSLSSIASECCGLITILTGTILLHAAKEKKAASAASPWPLDRGISWYISVGSDDLLRNVEDDYFAAPHSSPAPA